MDIQKNVLIKSNYKDKDMIKTLIAGPDYSMEFGWLVMSWVPYVRWYNQEKDIQNFIVICSPGREYLYKDITDKFINLHEDGHCDRWLIKNKAPRIPHRIIEQYPDAKVIIPRESRCQSDEKRFVRYGEQVDSLRYDLVIHARSLAHRDTVVRNWLPSNYAKVVRLLRASKLGNIRVASIGTKFGAFHIEGTDDLRDISIEQTCNVMASSKLLIGPSSGPMHLGELCGIPRIVWTIDAKLKVLKYRTNRYRYKCHWRPFNTPVKVIMGRSWKPDVTEVYKKVLRKLS